MPLVTRQATQGNLFKQDVEPPNWVDGDLWSDTSNNILNRNNNGISEAVRISTARLEALA